MGAPDTIVLIHGLLTPIEQVTVPQIIEGLVGALETPPILIPDVRPRA